MQQCGLSFSSVLTLGTERTILSIQNMNFERGYCCLLLLAFFSGMTTSTQIKPLMPVKIEESRFAPEKTYNIKSLVQ